MNENINKLKNRPAFEKRAIAKKAGVAYSTLTGVLNLSKRASVKLAIRLEKVTKGMVKKEDIRPDVNWELIE